MTRQSGNDHRGRSRESGSQRRRGTLSCPCPLCVHWAAAAGSSSSSQSAAPNTDNRLLEADIQAQIRETIIPTAEPIRPVGPPLHAVPLASIPPPPFPPPPPQLHSPLMGIPMPPPPPPPSPMMVPAKRSFSQIRGVEEEERDRLARRVRSVNEIRLFGKTIVIGSGDPAPPITINHDKEDAAVPADSAAGGLADVDGPTKDDDKDDPPPGPIAAELDPEPTSTKNSDK